MTKPIDFDKIANDYWKAESRLILLDYDGTLVPFEMHPDLTTPRHDVKSLMIALSEDFRNHVMLISGRDKENLAATWQNAQIVLVAEHGGYYKNPGNTWYKMFPHSKDWIEKVFPSLNTLTFQYEGSFVEKKSYSLAWHYRTIGNKITESEKQLILDGLRILDSSGHFKIYDGEFTIELRTPGIDKGSFVARWMGSRNYDFIMAIGDGHTDEDLFSIFGSGAYTIKVGPSSTSSANFHISSQTDVVPFLESILQFAYSSKERRTGLNS